MATIHDTTKSGLGLGVGGHDPSSPEEGTFFLFLGREAILEYYRKVNKYDIV